MKKLLLGPIAAAVYQLIQLVPRLLEMEQIPLVPRIGRSINDRSG